MQDQVISPVVSVLLKHALLKDVAGILNYPHAISDNEFGFSHMVINRSDSKLKNFIIINLAFGFVRCQYSRDQLNVDELVEYIKTTVNIRLLKNMFYYFRKLCGRLEFFNPIEDDGVLKFYKEIEGGIEKITVCPIFDITTNNSTLVKYWLIVSDISGKELIFEFEFLEVLDYLIDNFAIRSNKLEEKILKSEMSALTKNLICG